MNSFTLNIGGSITSFSGPQVMAIVNVTPDSFYSRSRTFDNDALRRRTAEILTEGADMVDIGAYSSRPGAADVSEAEETDRLCRGIEIVRSEGCRLPLSADTFRASVAEAAVRAGADIVNDISGGALDADMFDTVARLNVPYILMHMRGTPVTMASLTDYGNVAADVTAELARGIAELHSRGVADIIVDPGFGFAKTLEQNYELFRELPEMKRLLGRPMLAGISRKSMLTRLLGIDTEDALSATTALNAMALDRGADIIRVHDVASARQCVDIHNMLCHNIMPQS